MNQVSASSSSSSLLPTKRSRSQDDIRSVILQSHAHLDARLNDVAAQLAHVRETTDRTNETVLRIDQSVSIQRELLTQLLRTHGVSREVWFVRGLMLALAVVLALQWLL